MEEMDQDNLLLDYILERMAQLTLEEAVEVILVLLQVLQVDQV